MTQDAIGVMVAVVVIAAVAIPVATDAMVTDLDSFNENTTVDTTMPFNYTVNNPLQGVVEDSETITWINQSDTSDTAELTKTTDYTVVNYEDGTFELDYADHTSGDIYEFDYQSEPDGYIQGDITRTVVDYIPLALALSLFIAAISLVA